MEENKQNLQPVEEDTIDLVEILQKLWAKRKFILIVTGVAMALGLVVALLTPNQYTASCTLVPQTGQQRTGGNLGGLAAIAGINLGSMSTGEILSPRMYPIIIKNVNFQKEFLYANYTFSGYTEPISYYDYYSDPQYRKFNLLSTIKKYTIGLPGVIISALRGKSNNSQEVMADSTICRLSTTEINVLKGLYSAFSLQLNEKDGSVELSTTLTDPYFAAQITHKAQQLLQKYLTDFKLQKVRANLEFVESSYQEAKANFEAKQEELARFRDANKSLTSELARTTQEKLQSEYTLLLGVYTELAKSKEQAKIAVTETTPILTIIEPIVVPVEKSKPSRKQILIIYTLLGFLFSIGWVLGVPYIKETFSKVKNNKSI